MIVFLGEYVSRVEIRVSSESKHRLPVTNVCRWYHSQSIAMNQEGCWSVGGRPVEKYNDIRLCMAEANCEISGTLDHGTATSTQQRFPSMYGAPSVFHRLPAIAPLDTCYSRNAPRRSLQSNQVFFFLDN